MRRTASMIVGRAEIAAALGRSERTVTRWMRLGILACSRRGPFVNSTLCASVDEIDRLLTLYGEGEAE